MAFSTGADGQLDPISDSQNCAFQDRDDETLMYCCSIKCPSPIISPVSPPSPPSVDIVFLATPPPSPSLDLPDIVSELLEEALNTTGHFLLDYCGYDDHDDHADQDDQVSNGSDDGIHRGDNEYVSLAYDTEELARIAIARGRGNLSVDDIFNDVGIEFPLLAADDTCIEAEPCTRVDYLIHEWREEDLWTSWKYVVSHRYAEAEHRRLENTSWRTWAKCRLNLDSVSPECINWLKDDDLTWLYGPLKKYEPRERTSGNTTTFSPQNPAEDGGLGTIPKPILKKKSASETILQGCMSLYAIRETITAVDDALRAEGTRSVSWDPNTGSMVHSIHREASNTTKSKFSSLDEGHHVRFNSEVRQCIATDEDEEGDDDYDMPSVPDDDDCSSDDDGLFMIELPRKTLSLKSRPLPKTPAKENKTITLLPSTTIKFPVTTQRFWETSSLMSACLDDQSSFSTLSSTPPIDIPRPLCLRADLLLDYYDDLFSLSDDDDDPKSRWTTPDIYPFDEINGDFETEHDLIVDGLLDASMVQQTCYSYEPGQVREPSSGNTIGRMMNTVAAVRDIAHVLWYAS